MGTLAPKHIQSIFEAFISGQELESVTPVQQGLINNSYFLQTSRTAYILQRLNSHVFTAPRALMENLINFQNLPKPSGYLGPACIPTAEKDYLYKDPHDALWRLQEFVPQSEAYDLAPNPQVAQEAGRLLSQFHQISQGEDLEKYHSTLPGFQDIFLRLDQFSLAFKKADAALLEQSKEALHIKEHLTPFVSRVPSELPQRLCHNDTKLNNMLFHKESGKALCMVDLDTLMPGYAFYDFGDAFRTVANTAREGDFSTKVGFRKDYAQAFVQGLAQQKKIYTPLEWGSFAFGAVYMPYIHGLRALTDFLEGNRHYKVQYPTQNLDRSLSLFQFAEQAYDNKAYIQEILDIYFSHE